MNKLTYLLALFLFCLPVAMHAQDDQDDDDNQKTDISKYLVGAVPEKDGKVVFSQEISLPGMSKEQVFDKTLAWMEKRLKKNKNTSRVVYSDKEKGMIAGLAEEYIVFKSTALSLDRTLVDYQITATCQTGKCLMDIERIHYTYQEKEKFTAEDWIADNVALNKKQTKLVRGLSKFRIKTVDFATELLAGAQTALGGATAAAAQPAAVTYTTATTRPDVSTIPAIAISPEASASVAVDLPGYKQIAPNKIPGNIIKMLSEDWMLITAGNNEKFNMMTASWGGLGVLFDKPVMFCFINPTRYTYQLMETNDTYTLTFYTEAYRSALNYCGTNSGKNTDKVKGSGLTPITTPTGSKAFAEAWLIIECRKLVSQSLTPEAVSNKNIKEQWTGKQMHKMFIGEIINVWVK
ncbi:DUF4468 domain-containing protein [uncultured Bacteroides sp.]|uniref:DUF4468 domain-containing protein n=1 Tax=uncultured Bacteroides sp. TaxID=162156 RepID=UPI002AA6BD3F|nr:DUF4468 domain-containing protein [uncultured Bacteroides sp.]